ncbi:MAG: choice-of-anchor D domain-containing protein [Chloroflexi bacterium]|nr:MAG: choice-of-anchor D domain-containing protein [Chloroflexota bacterium]
MPTSATVHRFQLQHFQAAVTNSPGGVTWSVPGGSASGTLSNTNLSDADYTAPGRAGQYTVKAAANDDPTSFKEAVITVPPGVPSPPSGVLAGLTGPTSLNVTWNPPADDGGVALTGYQVTSSPDGVVVGVGATTQVASFTGLTPGTLYTFTVTATNSAGLTSAPSPPSPPIQIPPAGPMSIVPTAINFGTVALGQSASPQTVVVTADGNPLVISTVALGGTNPGEFAIQSDSCSGHTVPPGNTCSFNVLYIPTVQIAASGVVTITDSDSTSPQTVALTGSSPVQATSGLFPVGDIQMIDSQVGYVVDAGSFNRASVMKTTDGGKTWIRLPTPTNVVIDARDINIHFLDADHGFVFACLPSSSGACVTALVISTSDGGQTWKQLSNVPDHLGVKSMWFTDSMHGWITGGLAGPIPPPDYFGSSSLTGLYATTDGGLTWTKETLPDPILATPNCIPTSFNTGVKFVDSLHGWMAGTSICNSTIAPHGVIAQGALVWTTSDGGGTWTVHALPSNVITLNNRELDVLSATQMRTLAVLQDTPLERHIYLSFNLSPQFSAADLVFTDPTHGILVGSDGSIWRTADEGATWSEVGTMPKFLSSAGKIQSYTYTRMSSPDGTNVWVVGTVVFGPNNLSLQTAGFIEHSADGGATWTVQLLGNGT